MTYNPVRRRAQAEEVDHQLRALVRDTKQQAAAIMTKARRQALTIIANAETEAAHIRETARAEAPKAVEILFVDEIASELRKAQTLFPESEIVKKKRCELLDREVAAYELSRAKDPRVRKRAEQKKTQALRKVTN